MRRFVEDGGYATEVGDREDGREHLALLPVLRHLRREQTRSEKPYAVVGLTWAYVTQVPGADVLLHLLGCPCILVPDVLVLDRDAVQRLRVVDVDPCTLSRRHGYR